MIITRARLKSYGKAELFLSLQRRIVAMLENNPSDNYDFLIDDGRKAIKTFGVDNILPELVGKEIPIINDHYFAKFNEDGTVEVITKRSEPTNESLPRDSTVRQLKMLRKATKSTDIGDRISDMSKQGGNIDWIKNPIDSVESYEDFERNNKKFVPNWNLKHLISPWSKGKTKK